MSKLKARDIIAGWPRPRTVLNLHRRDTMFDFVFWNRRFFLGWPKEELDLYAKEIEAEDTYHQMQQAMVNEWFSRYRTGDKQFQPKETFAGPGEVGRAFEFSTAEAIKSLTNLEFRERIAILMKEELSEPETFWWLSFCDPDKPKGTQFLGCIVIRAHGFTDALMKCNVLGINPGGEVKGTAIPDTEEVKARLVPEVLNKLLSMRDMIDLGWSPVTERENL